LTLLDPIILKTYKEEGLVLDYWPTAVGTKLMQQQYRPLYSTGVVKPLIGIERGIAVEVKDVTMELIAARASSDRNVGAAVSSGQ